MEKNQEYYEKLDKRTKEYKEWKANKEKSDETSSKGLGDSVEKVLEATGVSDVVKFIAGEDCGCDERKERLNNIFPYTKAECFTEEEYNWIGAFIARKPTKVTYEERSHLFDVYNRVFNKKKNASSCSSCLQGVYNELKTYYEKYEG